MKEGKEYEDFVYKIFSEYFKGFTLKQNDRIKGNESGRLREIDISIRGTIANEKILMVVQAKDYKNHKADLNTLGTFSSAIKDIGASKGFLVCSSGFATSNSQYARTLGIELLSVEDIESKKWKPIIDIPVIFIYYDISYKINIPITMEQLGQMLSINHEDKFNFSADGGKTFLHINDHITNLLKAGKLTFTEKKEIIFDVPIRLTKFPSIDLPSVSLTTEPKKNTFLKYIKPDEYRGIKDHLNKTFIPTTFKISNIPLKLDSSFIRIEENEIPVKVQGFSIIVEATSSQIINNQIGK